MPNSESTPFLIASSVTAHTERRFSLEKTIQMAHGRADGTQLFINPEKFQLHEEDPYYLKDLLATTGLETNIVHLPGYLIPSDLIDSSFQAAFFASELLEPIPQVGKLCVIHHDPYAKVSNRTIVEATHKAFSALKDPDLSIGFEHYHPPVKTTQATLENQVEKYIELLGMLQEQVPAFAVFDLGRFYTINNANEPKVPLYDPNHKLLRAMCQSVKGQSVLIHAADCRDNTVKIGQPGNALRIGTEEGILTPVYRKLQEFGRKFNIKWIGIVDEAEDSTQVSNRDEVLKLFD